MKVLATKNIKNKSEKKVKGWKETKLPLLAHDNHPPRKAKKIRRKLVELIRVKQGLRPTKKLLI